MVGLKLTHLVSTTAASRETAARHGLLERIDINEFVNDERESTHTHTEAWTLFTRWASFYGGAIIITHTINSSKIVVIRNQTWSVNTLGGM